MVEVRSDFGYTCFLMHGICDRDILESNDHFQELCRTPPYRIVNTSVYTYSVGSGESEYHDEDELAIIEKYMDELD